MWGCSTVTSDYPFVCTSTKVNFHLFSFHMVFTDWCFSVSTSRTSTPRARSSPAWRRRWWRKWSREIARGQSKRSARRPSCEWPSCRRMTSTWTATSTSPAGMTARDSARTWAGRHERELWQLAGRNWCVTALWSPLSPQVQAGEGKVYKCLFNHKFEEAMSEKVTLEP